MEGVLGRLPEAGADHGGHDEGVPVDVLDDLLQHEEAAAEAPEEAAAALVVAGGAADLLVDELHHESEDLHHGEDEGSAGEGAEVVLQGPLERFPSKEGVAFEVRSLEFSDRYLGQRHCIVLHAMSAGEGGGGSMIH